MIATKVSTGRKSIWEAQKAKLKTMFPKLTEEDLDFDATNKDEMLAALEIKLGITAKELQVIIETL